MATIQGQELCSKVEAFLASGPLKGWVGGKGVEAASGSTFTTHDPGSGEVLAEVFSFQKAPAGMTSRAQSVTNPKMYNFRAESGPNGSV